MTDGNGNVRQLGEIRVTAVSDGEIDCPLMVIQNVDDAGAAVLAGMAAGGDMLHPKVNAYLIESGDRRVLIDAGAGSHMGGAAGRLVDNLAARGIAPTDIDAVILTHCHPDHILGAADSSGEAVFPRATLRIPAEDYSFWMETDPETLDNPFLKHEMQRAQMVRRAYGERVETIGEGAVEQGVTRVKLPGHTPGHSGYMVEGGGEQLLIWGDIVHFPTFQPGWPDASLLFDFDPDQAKDTRRRTFDWVISDALEFGGGHLHEPGFGRIERSGDCYRIVPSK